MTTIYIKTEDLPERITNDVYPTEHDLIEQALSHIHFAGAGMILDIGAGDGRWGLTAKRKTYDAQLCGIDIVGEKPEGFDRWEQADYLTYQFPLKSFDLIVSNPPYYIAEKIIYKAWEELAVGGDMIFLLRLSFQAGVNRAKNLWKFIHPYEVGIVSRRPSFYGRGTNGTDYGVYYWKKVHRDECWGFPGEWKTFLLLHDRDELDKTPKRYVQKSLLGDK